MKFSFDLDGTITSYPEVFVTLGKALRAAGHTVYILTGNKKETFFGDRVKKCPCISNKEAWYDEVITFDQGTEEERALIGTAGAHAAIGVFKRRIAEELEIDVHFDDDVQNVRATGSVPVFGVA